MFSPRGESLATLAHRPVPVSAGPCHVGQRRIMMSIIFDASSA